MPSLVIYSGSIDRKLESVIQNKGDAAELGLDGRVIGERTEDVNLAELFKMAWKEFDPEHQTLDEVLIQRQWPELRAKLQCAMSAWDRVESSSSSFLDESSTINAQPSDATVPRDLAVSHNY